jgi:hypothetical protein
MCSGQGQNWMSLDPRKHAFSLSGMLGRQLDKRNDLKDKLSKARHTSSVPKGVTMVAKGYGPNGT